MKKVIMLCIACIVIATSYAQVTTPRTPSPAASVSQTTGISTVTIQYSRPQVNGRVVWGNLVPYGWNVQAFGLQNKAPWRAGANENTVITLSHDAKIENKPVPAGSYGLFFVINEDNSAEVILSKDYRSWGSFFYDPAHDLLRANIQTRTIPLTERLTYDFIGLEKNTAELVLNWEKKQFPVKIEFNVDEIVMANATEELKSTKGFGFQGYVTAAAYSLQNKTDLEQGLKWIDVAITRNRSFATLNTKSDILTEMGKKEEAKKIKKEALDVANENDINNYGYQLLGLGKNDEAVEVLKLNTERFPASANAWDSLGEASALKGDKSSAVKYFKKSLSLNPPEGVKANSEKYLKQLGAM